MKQKMINCKQALVTKYLLLFTLCILNLTNVCAQSYIFAKNIGSTLDDYGYTITFDDNGNVYIVGVFRGTADFDPSAGTENLTSVGEEDIFFAKYDATGNYIYAKSIGSSLSDWGNGIAVDGSGNVYITGTFQGIADFDPGSGTTNLTSLGTSDMFFAKYDINGNYIYAKNIGSTLMDRGNNIVIDGSGNMYITGVFQATVDFDPGLGIENLTTVGTFDMFFAKYDTDGNYVYAKSIGSTDIDECRNITIDGSSNVYITGGFQGTADFDPGPGTANLTSIGSYDIFFAKYDIAGNYVYAKSIGSTLIDQSRNIAVDGSGNVCIIGYFQGTADFNPSSGVANLSSVGNSDIFFAKYDAVGNYIYANHIGSASDDIGIGIKVDGSCNVYITGSFQGTADFNPGSGTTNLTSIGSYDIFFAKYDAAGNYIFANSTGSASTDVGYGVNIDDNNNIYIIGSFMGTADFNFGTGIANLTSGGGTDIYFAKYNQVTGIEEFETANKDKFIIYPNPTHDKITIINNYVSKETNVDIFDLQGTLILDNNFQFQNMIEINVAHLQKGIYMVKMQTDSSVETRELIIQ
jgi:hypothetical protein